MPLVEVTLLEGRSPETIRTLIESLSTATQTALGVEIGSITVVVHAVPPTHWATGNQTAAERRLAISREDSQRAYENA